MKGLTSISNAIMMRVEGASAITSNYRGFRMKSGKYDADGMKVYIFCYSSGYGTLQTIYVITRMPDIMVADMMIEGP